MALTTQGGAGRFAFRAASSDGRVRRGTMVASSAVQAAERLAGDGLSVIDVRPMPRWTVMRSVSRRDVAIVFRNVATLVAAGVPIERAIRVSEALVSRRLADTLVEVRTMIREGQSVARALEAFPLVFPRAVVGIVRAGEAGSSMGEACAAIADHLEESAELQSRVRSALAYPAFILLVGIATIFIVGAVVVPRFALLLEDLGGELPPSTAALVAMSSGLQRFGPGALIGLMLCLPVVTWAVRSGAGRVRLDSALLKAPLVGPIRHGFATARTCRALGGMLEKGMPLLSALDAAADATGDVEVSRRIARAREAVSRGAPLTASLANESALDAMALQLIGIGESSGRLGPMVSRAGDAAASHAERALRTTVSLIEPMLVVLLGVLVAGVAASLLQAVYSIRPV